MRRLKRLQTAGVLPQWIAVFLTAAAARALHLWQLRGSTLLDVYLGDAAGYHAWAQRIAGGDWLGSEVFYQAPLYPYFLAFVYRLFGEGWAPRLIQALLGSLACVLLAEAGRRFFGARAGLVAGLGLALYPTAIFFDGLLQKSVLDNLFVCLLLWLLSRTLEAEQGARAWLWTGLVLGALILTRENALVLLLPVVLWLVWSLRSTTRRLALAGLLLVAGLALTLGPVALRNLSVGGGLHLTTSQFGPNFHIGNRAGASGLYEALRYGRGRVDYERLDAIQLAEEALGRELSAGEVSTYWRQRAMADIREQPLAWARLMVRKVALTWNAREIEDTEDQSSYAARSLLLRSSVVLHFGVLAPLALLGVWLTRQRWRELWLLYGVILIYAVSVAVFFVLARYRYPLVPSLMLFAGVGVVGARQLLAPSRRVELVRCAVLVLAFAVFCNWPLLGSDRAMVTTEVNLARALHERGELVAAKRHLERALELDPEHSLAHSNLADVLYLQGHAGEAIAHYRRALAVAPRDAQSHNNLGLALAAQGDAAGALDHYRQAVELDAGHPEALNNLAGALARRGQIAEALERYRQALAARPGYLDALVNRATVLAFAGRFEQALADLRAAAELAPGDAEIYRLEASVHSRLGDLEAMREARRRAAELASGEP